MAKKCYKPEDIVTLVRLTDILMSQGKNPAEAIRRIGSSSISLLPVFLMTLILPQK